MTVKELYDYAKENNLIDADIQFGIWQSTKEDPYEYCIGFTGDCDSAEYIDYDYEPAKRIILWCNSSDLWKSKENTE